MAEVILETSTYSGFELHSVFQVYGVQFPATFELTVGKEYTVFWDGTEWPCTAQDVGLLLGAGAVALGNVKAINSAFAGNNEPFIVATVSTDYMIAALNDTAAGGVHSVGIFAADESGGSGGGSSGNSNNVVLKDRDGGDLPFTGVETVRLVTDDGGTKDFISGKPVEKTIEPDFSAGDMTVLPEVGELFSEVTVQRPLNLWDFNIAEGIDIAGVIGTMKTGGVDPKFERVTVPSVSSAVATVSHTLGVVPDVAVYVGGQGNNKVCKAFSVSSAFGAKYGINGYSFFYVVMNASGVFSQTASNAFIDATSSGYGIHHATETDIQIGNSTRSASGGALYLFGGLT